MSEQRQPVAVLVVTYNHEDEIAACLDTALAQAQPVEIVVADNGSTDRTRSVLAGYSDRIRVLERANDGFAEGVNAAFAATGGSGDVLLLNPDVEMDRGCLAALSAHLASSPRCAAAAATLRDHDGGLQRFARRDPDLRQVAFALTEVGQRVDQRRGFPHARSRCYEEEFARGLDGPLVVDNPAGACVLVRRELLNERPLDPRFPLFYNDSDLWRRLRRDGWTIEIVPEAGAKHGFSTSVRRADPVRIRAEWVVATRRYLASELGPVGRAALAGIFLADALAAGVLLALGSTRESTGRNFRGNLGGLGLPGGPDPWLSRVRRIPTPSWLRRLARSAR